MSEKKKLEAVEGIKSGSDFLRGSILKGLQNPITGALKDDDTQLTKFHGIYQQDDRDLRAERRKQKLEPFYSFMVRIRVPGGVCTPAQWLKADELARTHASGTLKLTTRQAFQWHGVIKTNLKPAIAEINKVALDTIAACGDVNRNVMCSVNPYRSAVHSEVLEWANKFSDHLTPRTTAYCEIWLNGQKINGSKFNSHINGADQEPIYGKNYLPRKFKTAMAIPPHNDTDVYSQDLGFIAVVDNDTLAGFNVTVGGGMGTTHGIKETYPRLADTICFIKPEEVLEVGEEIVKIQRDFGCRTNRKHARLKYTIDDRGIDWFKKELVNRLGHELVPPRKIRFERNGDEFGWEKGVDGKWYYTAFIQGGRVFDSGDYPIMTGIREIAKVHKGQFLLTGNQNIILGGIEDADKEAIEALLIKYKLAVLNQQSGLRLTSLSCVAFPTCGLAMAEAERYLPTLLEKLEKILADNGLSKQEIVIRMTGCPNGCARPFLGEIAFIGKAPGRYNIYLGASFVGDRLNKLYRENLNEEEIIQTLEPIIVKYAKERQNGEYFGDFVIRTGIIHATKEGKDFHDNVNVK